MGFSIESFKSRGLPFHGARPSAFEVFCTFPASVSSQGLEQQQGGRFVCTAASAPALLLGEVSVPYFGRPVKFKGDRNFQDWDVTIINDEDFALRNAFEEWQNMMNYMESNILDPELALPDPAASYKQDMVVRQFAKAGPPEQGEEAGEVIRTYQIVGAWPKVVGPINLGWHLANDIETFTVSFAYDYFIIEGPTSSLEAF